MSRELEMLHSDVMICTKCELHKSRARAVPGEGPDDARVMFIGEGPGENEDREGRPFVGAAGKLLTELLDSIGIKRSEVFITNIVKCRPPSNRPPRQTEIDACNPYLQAQTRLISPRVICPLGSPAIKTVMGAEYSATAVHGKPFRKGGAVILPLYHPAAALYDPSLRELMFQDVKVLKDLLDDKIPENRMLTMSPGQDTDERSLRAWL